MRYIIIANGIIRYPEIDRSHIQPGDLIIAADGGLTNCQRLGIQPDLLIGDLDSVLDSDLLSLQEQGCEILTFPSRKDETDLELALLLAMERGAEQLLLIGALGARWDQTLTNLLIGFHSALPPSSLRLVDGSNEIVYLQPDRPFILDGQPGDTVSLIPMEGGAKGIKTAGLEYELQGEDLIFGQSRGVSNVMVQNQARIEFMQGLLICIHIHQNKRSSSED